MWLNKLFKRKLSTKKKTFKQLDEVMKVLFYMTDYTSTGHGFGMFAHRNNLEMPKAIALVDKLVDDKYAVKLENREKKEGYSGLVYRLNLEGRFFFESGGYSNQYHSQIRSRIWTIAKTIIIAINTTIITVIAYWTANISKKANKDGEKVIELSKQIDSLKSVKMKKDTVYIKDVTHLKPKNR